MANLNGWNLNANTGAEGLDGIYSKVSGELPCATKELKAMLNGEIVAHVSWETLGDQYRYAQRRFGDQLEAAGFSRQGY